MMGSKIRFLLSIFLLLAGHTHAQYVKLGIRGNVYMPLDTNYLNRVGFTVALEMPVVSNYSISVRGGVSEGGHIYERRDLAYIGMVGVLREFKMNNNWSIDLGAEFGFSYRKMSDNELLDFGNVRQKLLLMNTVFGFRKSIGSSISVQILLQPGYEYIISQTGSGLRYLNFQNSIYLSNEIGLIYTLQSN